VRGVKYKNLPLAEACRAAVHLRDDELSGDKGIIALAPTATSAWRSIPT
jgi:hypothetical protein